ncbi:autotransporter outer membrane beta-barrel domain-containing protein [Phascolarctobacterium faecium]|uniref:hypothetical protein n=1 Tax=Phascolarctobacterium faecium TaxID=33025 RepID=UPI000F0C5BEE|nr:hypothetical protein [Phascolarctobacterium faecium]BBG63123.1 hypothetical protein PFJ30894_00749 [Phascolarctobacterium faecium]
MNYTKVSRAASLRSARIAADIQTLINNRSYYKFQYTPLTGPLPGLSFEQQTEDAINDIGNMSYGSYEIATQALTTANQAYNAAQSAIEIANHAETTAQNAQTTANNAAKAAAGAQKTADNAAKAAADAQKTADNAAKAAAKAQETADNAQSSANTAIATATDAQTTADNAQNDATSALNRLDSLTPVVEELRYYDNIDTAVDLNDKTEFARELLEASNNTNAPETGSGWLDVDDDFNETYIRQKFMGQASGKTYVRFGTIVPDSDPVTVSEWSNWVEYTLKSDLDNTTTDLTEKINTVATDLAGHEADFNNPHKVTAEQLGLTTVYQYKGSVATYADLPTTGQKVGDVWNVETADPDHGIKAGDNVAWDGAQWDILGGNHDLSGYAQLNAANTFTAANKFNSNIVVRAATAAGSAGIITLGEKPSYKTEQCLINAAGNGNVIIQASENQIVALQSGSVPQWSVVSDEANTKTSAYLHSNLAATYTPATGVVWEGNANTATKLATARTINGVPFDGTKDITIEAGGGGGDVTAAGDNNFTGTNTFNKPITVRDGALAGIGGTITLGMKPNSATTQAKINSTTTGAMYYTATEGLAHFFNVGATEVATVGGTETTATLDFLANRILDFNNTNGLQVGAGATGNIYLNPTTADTKGSLRLRSVGAMEFNGNELHLNKNGDFNGFSDFINIKFNNNAIITYSNAFKNLGIRAMGDDNKVEIGVAAGAWNIQLPNNNGDVRIANRLYVGNKNGVGAGVISAENSEQCLYFMGTAENTYYATPNTGNTISYQTSANCYLINCSINNPSSLNMNFSGMNFKATVGSSPYMCKTLTFWLAVGATVPTVAWTFPTDSAVYYPKGVAPVLTANANNIINVIAIVDDTGSFSIQVCDSVALPFSG